MLLELPPPCTKNGSSLLTQNQRKVRFTHRPLASREKCNSPKNSDFLIEGNEGNKVGELPAFRFLGLLLWFLPGLAPGRDLIF
jgi:hypothetical protein